MSTVMKLYWNPTREDNITTITRQGELDAKAAGYFFIRNEGYAYASSEPNTVPLQLYWSPSRGDNLVAASEQSQQDALAAGYEFVRTEGYVFPTQEPNTIPLKLYWNAARGDYFTTATQQGEQDAKEAGYQFVRVEGYISPRPTNIDIELESKMSARPSHIMTTKGVLLNSGHIDAQTRTRTTTLFGGFHGSVQIVMVDANDYVIDSTLIRTFGVDGTAMGRSDRSDYWSQDMNPDTARRTASIHILHFESPTRSGPRVFIKAVAEAVAEAKPITDLIKDVKGLGGDGK